VAAATDPRRAFLLSLFQAGLAAVDGRARMRAALAGRDDLRDVWVIAAGKASSSMTLGALDALGPRVRRALVVSRSDCVDPALPDHAGVTVLRGGHPVPDASSLDAGRAVLQLARQAAPRSPVLLLVSGGASSLLEVLPAGLGLPELRRFTEWALGCGRDIAEVNAVRRRLSCLKDGRLLAALSHARVEGYYLSDVPGDDPAVVGSGLLAPARGDAALPEGLPEWVHAMVRRGAPPPAAVPGVPVHCIGNLDQARAAIVAAAGEAWPVSCPPGRMEGDAVRAAKALCARLARPGERLWVLGGETTVVLPPGPGRGGRNQHFALAAAREIAGSDDLLVLAAGSDGSDGNTTDAGALVDGGSLQRGEDGGCDALHCLETADSGRFLEASGDLVHTGATGTNVGDLVLGLRCEAGHSPDGTPSM
jgi:glycerate 2-kinase